MSYVHIHILLTWEKIFKPHSEKRLQEFEISMNHIIEISFLWEKKLSRRSYNLNVTETKAHPNLHEEVSEMFLERWDVVIQIEQSLNCDFNLIIREMWESRFE